MRDESQVRILFCIPRLVGGGAERQLSQLLPRLVERGIGVSLFSRLTRNEVASLEAAGIACYPIRAAGNHDPRLLGELAVAARHSRAAIIHSWLTQMDVLGGAVALTTGRSWALAAAMGIEANVIFAGFRPDAWSWLKAACLFVSASSVEGQPNAVMEAAAAGTPQVLSDIVMHRNTVGDGGALFFEPSDPEAMAVAIAELLENPACARAIVA